MPAAKKKMAKRGKNRLHNASRASRPAFPLSSPMGCAGRSISAASRLLIRRWAGAHGELAGFDTIIVCTPRAANQQAALPPPSGAPTSFLPLDQLHVCALWAAARQPASVGCGAAAGVELGGTDHFHLYALRAAARQPAWAGGGAAAGWELDGADHLCAFQAAVRRLALAGCGAISSILPSYVTTAHLLNCLHSHIATPHAPAYSLTQVPGWNRDPILTGPHLRSRRPSCTPHHIPPSHVSIHPSLTPPSIANGDLSPLWGSTFSPAGPPLPGGLALARPPVSKTPG